MVRLLAQRGPGQVEELLLGHGAAGAEDQELLLLHTYLEQNRNRFKLEGGASLKRASHFFFSSSSEIMTVLGERKSLSKF